MYCFSNDMGRKIFIYRLLCSIIPSFRINYLSSINKPYELVLIQQSLAKDEILAGFDVFDN